MATIGNLYNADSRGSSAESALGTLGNILLARKNAEIEMQLKNKAEIELQRQKDELVRQNVERTIKEQRANSLLSLINTKDNQLESDKSIYGKTSRVLDNPKLWGVSVLKPKAPQNPPPSAMMSLVNGAYGNEQGNPLYANVPNEVSSVQIPPQTMVDQQQPIQTVFSKPSMTGQIPSIRTKINERGLPEISFEDNSKELDKLQEEAAKLGINAYGLDRQNTLRLISEERNKRLNPQVQDGYEISGYNANGEPIIKKIAGMPASVQKMMKKDMADVYETSALRDNLANKVSNVLDSLDKIPHGLFGKAQVAYLNQFQPDNPILADWQRLKSLLTDTQLLYTAKTKGAISDREMELFRDAAANDNLNSIPRIKVVLEDMLTKLDAELKGKTEAFKRNYEQDPFGNQNMNDGSQDTEYQRYLQAVGE